MKLYIQGPLAEGNTLEFHHKGSYGVFDRKHEKFETVQCKTLDSFDIKKSSKKLCIKIDVEGHDIEVFEGASELLKHADVVIAEVNFINMNLDESGKRKKPSFSTLCTLCEKENLYPIILHTFGDQISNYAFRRDVIFVKEGLLDNVIFK
ncbi:MAG: FkbM family methyltransferase [Gammaproteobacteria bacterium]|nr:FkbM family methyltransferase [Gammaproteobacteria bacterium]